MIATDFRSAETFELPLALTGGLSADEADRRVAVAPRAGDIGARALSFYLAGLAESSGYQEIKGTDLFTGRRQKHPSPLSRKDTARSGSSLPNRSVSVNVHPLPLKPTRARKRSVQWMQETATISPISPAGPIETSRLESRSYSAGRLKLRAAT